MQQESKVDKTCMDGSANLGVALMVIVVQTKLTAA